MSGRECVGTLLSGMWRKRVKSKKSSRSKRKPFAGDATHRLPTGMMEHYRLWFAFLKLAYRDPAPKGKINTAYYADWGDVASADFDEWWILHWRDLFGVPLSVVDLSDKIDGFVSAQDSSRIVLSIDVAAGLKKTLSEIKEILKRRTAGLPRKKHSLKQKGRFSIDGVTELRRLNIQQALKVFEFSLENDDLDEIVARYVKWADSWKPGAKGWNGRNINVPSSFRQLMADIDQGARKLDNYRRSARRVLRRGRTIANNVAKGVFPGKYA